MTESIALETIDFLTHSKISIAATAVQIWPSIIDLSKWRTKADNQQLRLISGEPGQVGARFVAVAAAAPDAPLFYVENAEMFVEQRRTIRLESLEGSFMGFATWELTPNGSQTVVAYDVYCRGPMLPPGLAQSDVIASQQERMQEGLIGLKAFIEG